MDKDCRVRVNCHAVKSSQYEAIAFMPGIIVKWFRDMFFDGKPYSELDKEAEKIPVGSHGMMCAFSDVMDYISWKHASPTFTNFSFNDKFNKYTFYRAILENAALVTKGHLELVAEVTGCMPNEIVFAGGASQSPLWCQILADVIGLPVNVPVVKEATALGAAILAGKGAGLYADVAETAERLVKWDAKYLPNKLNAGIYEEIYRNWRKMYGGILKLSNDGVIKHMWKA
jgi:autoinducer 2 (AI-2) kinase